jgi:hypothetical protein
MTNTREAGHQVIRHSATNSAGPQLVSNYQVLRAFADGRALSRASAALEAYGYRGHEFGDSMLVEKRAAVGRRLAA